MAVAVAIGARAGTIVDKKPKDSAKGSSALTEKVEEYLKLMEAEGLHELEISDGDTRIKLVKQSKAAHVAPRHHAPAAPAAKKAAAAEDTSNAVLAPLAGIFYRASSPTAAPFAKEGDVIAPGRVLCIIEAMKVMNEIQAETSGRITRILVENGKPVQGGQKLFLIEPA